MRPRSISIYVKPPCQPEDSTHEPTTGSASRSKRAYSTEEFFKMFEDFGPIEETHVKDAFSGDFQCCPFESTDSCCSTTDQSISPQMTLSQLSSKSRSEDVLDEDPKVNKIFRGMIIGAKGTEKQALVNAMFSSFDEEEEARQGFDLRTRRIETEESIERYHFWLKDAWTENNRRHESVMSVYYKTCSAFFLIYDTEDRTSFDCLEQEIKLIKGANTNKEVRLVLIGNKGPEANKRQVTYEEARCFKEKFNVQMFLEVEISFEMLDELREAIQDLAK